MGDTHDFLRALFGDKHPQAGVQVWHKDTKKAHTFIDLKAAEDHVLLAQDHDVYVSAGMTSKPIKPSKTRLTNNTVASIPGVWADIDVNGGPEGKTNAAPDLDAARELAEAVLKPTLVVNSGYGLQGWWLFEGGPWNFANVAEREQAQRLVQAFQAALKAKARTIADSFTLDSTHDLARLMRIPGTQNHKGSTPVAVTIVANEGSCYTIEAIGHIGSEYLAEAAKTAQDAVTGDNVEIALHGTNAIPSWRVGQLVAVDMDFKVVWERKKLGKARDWSDSSFDLSIATRLAEAGASDQEMADALVFSRLNFGSDPQGKSGRLDYIKRTIAKAKQRNDLAERNREQEAAREDAADQLEAIAVEGPTASEPTRTVSLFTQLLGGPEVKELVQDSRDPDQARFRIVLADGREVPIGTGADLLSADRFRSAFAIVTGHVVPAVKRDKWHKVIQALLHAATVNEESDETRAARVHAIVRDYVDRGASTDREAACQAHDPFVHDGDIYVPLDPLTHWLRRVRGERLVSADVKQLLIAGGFERKTVNYVRDTGKKSSRSYWVGDADVVLD